MNGSFKPMDTLVLVKQLAVHAQVGVGAPERRAQQTLLIDLEIALKDPIVREDKMAASVNYVTVVSQIEEMCASNRVLLLETLAERIAERVFEDPRVGAFAIEIAKARKLPHAEAVGVRRTFVRAEG